MGKSFKFSLGDISCATLFDGSRTMPLRATFPAIPESAFGEVVIAEEYPTEVTVGYNILYLTTAGKHCLIDSGIGSGELLVSLETLGLNPEDIDTLIVTHNDGDHIGGLKDFPNAEIVMARKAWELWTNEAARQGMIQEFIKLFEGKLSTEDLEARAASRENHGAKILPSLKDRVRLVEPDEEILKGIHLIYAPGHRTDHYAVDITSGEESLIHVADSIRHPVQAKYPWASFIDSYPEQVLKTNEKLLDRILHKNALIFGMHFPFPALARVSEQNNKRTWQWIDAT